MSCDTDDCHHGWHYGPARTLPGQLQRGLGRGAYRAVRDPAAADLVLDCVRRDHRWDWQVDERHVYLARLVRDLDLPVARLVERLDAAPPKESDDDNEFELTLGVLEVLARAGSEPATGGDPPVRAGGRPLAGSAADRPAARYRRARGVVVVPALDRLGRP